jgi:hypothetical protein
MGAPVEALNSRTNLSTQKLATVDPSGEKATDEMKLGCSAGSINDITETME